MMKTPDEWSVKTSLATRYAIKKLSMGTNSFVAVALGISICARTKRCFSRYRWNDSKYIEMLRAKHLVLQLPKKQQLPLRNKRLQYLHAKPDASKQNPPALADIADATAIPVLQNLIY